MPSRIAALVTVLVAIVFVAATAHCQTVASGVKAQDVAAPAKPIPPPPLLQPDDKFEGRTLELEEAQALAAVQQSPQYAAAMAAQRRRADFFRSLFDKYKLDAAKYTLCDGPGQPPNADPSCKGVAKGDIVWRAIVQPEKAAPAPAAATEPKK